MFRFKTSSRKFIICLLAVTCAVSSISWTTGTVVHTSGLNYDIYAADTVPEKPRSLEEQIRLIEKAQQNLQREMSQKDWNKIEAEMENAIGRINTKEIEAQMQKAMAELDRSMTQIDREQLKRNLDLEKVQSDLAKVKQELEKEFSKKDWQRELNLSKEEMQKAMQEINAIDQKKLQEELARTKEEIKRSHETMFRDLERAKIEMRENKGRLKESLEEARKGLEKVRLEFEGYKTMIDQMRKEGLIKDGKNYEIEYKNGELKINGKKQPANVTDRYRKYFHGKTILLKNENDQFEIENKEEDGSTVVV